MSGRQAGARRAGRDATSRDDDMQLEILNTALELIRKAKEYNDESIHLGQEILALEEEIKTSSTGKSRSSIGSTPEQHRRLDELYRKKLRTAESEKRVHEEEDIATKLQIIKTMRTSDEPPASRAAQGKGRTKSQYREERHRPIIESDVSTVGDGSGAVSPAETTDGKTATGNPRVDHLKRKQSGYGSQRGSTPSGAGRPGVTTREGSVVAADKKDGAGSAEDQALHKGLLGEKSGELKVGTEVFYKYAKSQSDDVGVGIQCIVKKVHVDRKPIVYDVQDPEPDPSGKQSVHRATAKDLYPIPSASSMGSDGKGVTFQAGATVYAKYPDTDTFYRATVVRGLKGGEYTLRFEGEEDDTEKAVERRFVLDTRMR